MQASTEREKNLEHEAEKVKNELQKMEMEMEICGREVEGGYLIENTF